MSPRSHLAAVARAVAPRWWVRGLGLAGPAVLAVVLAARAAPDLGPPWPAPEEVADREGKAIEFSSHSPFTLFHVGKNAGEDPPTTGIGTLFLPDGASPQAPAPAVVMLHGAAGVLSAREMTYGRQLAAMGVAALVVDAFAARRDRARSFVERLIEITETMLIADAYSALAYLSRRPDIDGERVVLIGFSYGGMAATYAAYAQVAERLAPTGVRFAGHVAFYAPCIASFVDYRATGAPVLMLFGDNDAIVDRRRCEAVADELRAGGAAVEMVVYRNAYHQWDGYFHGPREIGRNLAGCRLVVERDGRVRDGRWVLPMIGVTTRKLILALCVDDQGYLIGRDDDVRRKSNRDLGRFLETVFARP